MINNLFSMTFRHRRGHVYIQLHGAFCADSAKELMDLVDEQRPEGGRAFVDTKKLDFVAAKSKQALTSALENANTPHDLLFFKGKQGLLLAPQGCRVLISPENSGCSACAKCAAKKAQNAICAGQTALTNIINPVPVAA